jgi:hypothetical protein
MRARPTKAAFARFKGNSGREGHGAQARPVKTFGSFGDATNGAAEL